MKIQDIVFFAILLFLLYKRHGQYFVIAGLFCLVLAIPFFYAWIFFTGERLTWYSAAFFTAFIVFSLKGRDKVQ